MDLPFPRPIQNPHIPTAVSFNSYAEYVQYREIYRSILLENQVLRELNKRLVEEIATERIRRGEVVYQEEGEGSGNKDEEMREARRRSKLSKKYVCLEEKCRKRYSSKIAFSKHVKAHSQHPETAK